MARIRATVDFPAHCPPPIHNALRSVPNGSAAAAAATAASRGRRRGPGQAGHGQQLHGVGVALGAARGCAGLAHRAIYLEGVTTVAALELIGRHTWKYSD